MCENCQHNTYVLVLNVNAAIGCNEVSYHTLVVQNGVLCDMPMYTFRGIYMTLCFLPLLNICERILVGSFKCYFCARVRLPIRKGCHHTSFVHIVCRHML